MSNFHRTFKTALVERIRDDIVRGRYPPGHHLGLEALALDNDVSTMPIREALRVLEADGIVTTIPQRGAYVTRFTADELEDIYEMRAALEQIATRVAVAHLNDNMLSIMQTCIDRWQSVEQDFAAIVRLNTEFHMTLYHASGRKHLCEEITRLHYRTHHYLHAYAAEKMNFKRSGNEHQAIFDACRARDAATAAKLIYDHVWHVGVALATYVRDQSEAAV